MKATGLALLALGIAALVAGLVIGFSSLRRDAISCGSPFGGLSGEAASSDRVNSLINSFGLPPVMATAVADCKQALADKRPEAWGLTAPGGVLLLIGATILIWAGPARARR